MSVWPRGGVFGADSRRQNVRSRRSRLRFARGHLCQVATEAVFARLRRAWRAIGLVPFRGSKKSRIRWAGTEILHSWPALGRAPVLFRGAEGNSIWTADGRSFMDLSGLIPHAMDVRESLNAALLVWGLASRLFIRVIKNPTHTKSFSSTGRERAFLRGFRKTRSFQHLLMGVLACLLKNTPSQHGGFVAFCNVSKKMRYELDSQIPGIPGSEYPGRPKWTIRSWKARQLWKFYSGKLMRHG